jgi:two-component system chemotaxis sensor kinase CheA
LRVVVVTAGSFQYGLIVEKLHDTVEIVVKPLGRHFKNAREYAGATIMGDGRVALILDVAGLAGLAGLSSLAGSARSRQLSEEKPAAAGHQQEAQSLLLFHNAPAEYCAVPLELVSRVEQIKPSDVETVGGTRVMQYRGAMLPVLAVGDVANVQPLEMRQEKMLVIVFRIYGREVGLLANHPVDVIECQLTIDQSTLRQRGIMGSAIVNRHTTMIVDIFELVEALHPEWAAEKAAERGAAAAARDGATVLLAEDSDFFRDQVKNFIEADGYTVLAAEDGLRAWELLQANARNVRVVVTDVEMPNLDGLGLTRRIRQDARFTGLPVVAVSSLAGEDDIARGKAAGVNLYQVKLDKEKLLESVRRFMTEQAAAATAK